MSPKLDAAMVCLQSPVEEGSEAEMEAEMGERAGVWTVGLCGNAS